MDSTPHPRDVDFFFDPSCEWTWIASRWLVTVSEQRDLRITWHPYSLAIKHGDDVDEKKRDRFDAGRRVLRVVVDLTRRAGNDAVGAFYAEHGYQLFGTGAFPDVAHVLAAAGLDPTSMAAADDESLDDDIRASMDEAHRLAGSSNGSPILSIRDIGHGFFGPVLTAVPAPDSSGRLWEHVSGMFDIPEFHELKRDRSVDPTHPPRSR